MMNLHQPNLLIVGFLLAFGAVFARPLINLNLRVYRTVGLSSWAGFWRRQLRWWLPAVRWACIFGAIGFLAMGLGIV
jgi:hypothetical protein